MEAGCLLLVAALGVVLFLLALVVGVPLALAGGALAGLWMYLAVLHRTLVASPPAPAHPPPASPGQGEQPAYRQYFFGQATTDLRMVVRDTYGRCTGTGRALHDGIKRDYLNESKEVVEQAVGVVLAACLGAGLVAGLTAATVAVLLHVMIMGGVMALARAGIGGLRAADTVALRIRGITITCGTCHHRVPYPEYACPGCGLRHTDVRPGRYGVLLRTCRCLARLPTLLLLGSHRLAGFCPYCGHPLAAGIGSDPEVILSFLGVTASGKTRLMLALVGALAELTTAAGGTVAYVGADTRSRLNALLPLIARGSSTPPTAPGELPRAYSLYVTPPRGGRRFVHVFDVAGERLHRRDDVDELRYLGLTRTFVFVLDPLSVDALWQVLSEADRERLHDLRARRPPHDLFAEVSQRVQALGADVHRSRLAVAVSKNDLIARLPPLAGVDSGSGAIEAWLETHCGLGNLVRSMRHEFGEVRFFFTAAVVDGRGGADPTVLSLVRWLLGEEGMSLDGARP